MENTLKKPMTGIIPPLVTPLLDNDKLDIDGLERLIERLIAFIFPISMVLEKS